MTVDFKNRFLFCKESNQICNLEIKEFKYGEFIDEGITIDFRLFHVVICG
jgi:hypothetical protein